MGNGNQFTRRGFIAGGAIAGATALVPTPFERFLDALTKGIISNAHAEATGNAGGRNLVNIISAGGPLRYSFDHWMRVNSNDPTLVFNPMVATKFVSSSGRVTGVQYSTFDYHGVQVPHMFSHSVYNSSGSQRPLTDLLNNMLVIRGYGSGFDGHAFNASIQQAPVGGVSSLAGLAADYSRKTFEAVEWPNRGSFGNYFSVKGKALNKLPGSTPLNSLLEGFGNPQSGRVLGRNLKERNRDAYDLAQARLVAYAQSDFAGATIVGKNLSNATKLMKKGIGNINDYWKEAVGRYRSVMENSLRQTNLAGISDSSLISDESKLWSVHVTDGNRGLIVSKDTDLRSSITTMDAPGSLSEGLALAEYVLKEGLVTSLNLQASDIQNLSLTGVGSSSAKYTAIHDMHETGAIASLFLTTTYYRALAAGILELADQLKKTQVNGTDLWSETVVQYISEFDRVARSNGSGSDHGYNQMVTSVYSGAIKNGPFVVGNISKNGVNSTYDGTQGIAAAIDGYNQKSAPTPAMAASTVAALLRVEKNPYQNIAAPLVELSGDTLKVAHTAKIVG
ncbi:MAG: twin-arginine translocation signal domain-containing protein [Bdellovibrio sp.]